MTEVKYVEFCVFIEFTFFVLNPFMMIFCVLTNFLSEIISNKTKMAENHTICSFRKSNTELLLLYLFIFFIQIQCWCSFLFYRSVCVCSFFISVIFKSIYTLMTMRNGFFSLSRFPVYVQRKMKSNKKSNQLTMHRLKLQHKKPNFEFTAQVKH